MTRAPTVLDIARDVRRRRWPARAGRRRRPSAVERASTGCPTHDDIENVVVLGMGGSGIAGDLLAVVAGPFMPVPVVVAQGLRAPRLRRRAHAGVRRARSRATPRRPSRRVTDAAAAGGARRRASAAAASSAELAAGVGRTGACRSPTASRCRVPASARWPSRRSSCSSRSGCSRARRRGSTGAVEQLRACAATSSSADGNPAGRWPGASGAPCRSSTAAAARRGGRACGGRRSVNENAKVPAFVERHARAVPQRDLRVGPARRRHPPGAHAASTCATTHEHPQVARRFELVSRWPSTRWSPASTRSCAEGEGRSPSCSTSSCSATSSRLHLAAQEGIDPGPDPGAARLTIKSADRTRGSAAYAATLVGRADVIGSVDPSRTDDNRPLRALEP